MIPDPPPPELKDLTEVEELLIARIHVFMKVFIKQKGSLAYSGHVISFV